MQLQNLYKPMSEMTDEELKERLKEIRHNRTVARPAAATRAKKEASKGNTTRANKLRAMLDSMSPTERAQLLLDLGVSDE